MRRLIANELILSFVPGGEQRTWRNLTRMKLQHTRDRARLDDRAEKTRRDYCTVTATLAVWDSGGVVLVAVTAMV